MGAMRHRSVRMAVADGRKGPRARALCRKERRAGESRQREARGRWTNGTVVHQRRGGRAWADDERRQDNAKTHRSEGWASKTDGTITSHGVAAQTSHRATEDAS